MAKTKKKLKIKKVTVKKKNPAKKTLVRKTAKKKIMAVPKGYNSITPYLIVAEAAKAIEFYKKAFAAKEVMRMEHSGRVGHAELKLGDAKIMLADECPEMNAQSPKAIGGSPVGIHLYIKNVDDVVQRALSLGASLVRPVETMFYGDRSGALQDPYGHIWYISTHVEDVTPAKIKKRAAELFGKK